MQQFELEIQKFGDKYDEKNEFVMVLLISVGLANLVGNNIVHPLNPLVSNPISKLEDHINTYETTAEGYIDGKESEVLSASKNYVQAIKEGSKDINVQYKKLIQSISDCTILNEV